MDENKTNARGGFNSNFGFLMAAVGSAVGLGNMWKFPYITGQNGGGAFVLVYLIIVFTIGVCVLVGEMIIGRKTKLNAVGSYKTLDNRFTFAGIMGLLSAFLIVTYYDIIGGWVLKYLCMYIVGKGRSIAVDSATYFSNFIASSGEVIIWTLIFALINLVILNRDISSGLETACKFMMPALFIIVVVIAFRSCTLPGAGAGVEFFLKPDFSKINMDVLTAALSQVFFSLSLGMGIMITYGSYMKDGSNIEKMGWVIPVLDTLAALIAGFAILPACFAFGLEPGAGPGLIFITLPKIFDVMPGGGFVAVLFFLLVLFAALSSSLSLLEVPNSFLVDKYHWDRKKSIMILLAVNLVFSILEALSYGPWTTQFFGMPLFDFAGYIAESLLMPLAGLFMCIFLGWFYPAQYQFDEVEKDGVVFKGKGYYRFVVKYLAPVAIMVIWLNSSGILKLFAK